MLPVSRKSRSSTLTTLIGSSSRAAISTTAVGLRQIRRIFTCSDCMPGAGSRSLTMIETRSNGSSSPGVRP